LGTHHRATERHLPYGITQYYVPPDTREPIPALYMGGGPDLRILLP